MIIILIMNSLLFSRRFITYKSFGLISSATKYSLFYGSLKNSRNYTRCLLQKNIYPACQNTSLISKINEFRISRRSIQTSSDQEKSKDDVPQTEEEPPEKMGLFKRYKKMLKEYWYVLLPVHGVTSVLWFGGFYYAAQCGIDIVPFLEYINLPEQFIEPLRKSSLGYIAVASAFYKLATPARYMVTLGGTTVAVKFLVARGLIKPAPTQAQIRTIIQNKLKKETVEKK